MIRPALLIATIGAAVSCSSPTQQQTVLDPLTSTPTPKTSTPAIQTPRPTTTAASRTRTLPGLRRPASGSPLTSTAYCETGLMANGQHTYRGAAAGNRWPLGTRLHVSDSPYGPGTYTVTDRIGHGSQLDFAMPGDCTGARTWGRRTIRVQVLP